MATYTSESLQNDSKKDLIPIILSLQIKYEEGNNSAPKQVSALLSSRLVSMKRQCWLNAQYSRRECLDTVGIPSDVEADALKKKVIANFEKLGYNIPTGRIEASYSLIKAYANITR